MRFFPYAGSKQKAAPLLSEIIRQEGYKLYVEPMVGSGAVFFHLRPRAAYLGDICGLHINLYQSVQQVLGEVLYHLDGIEPTRQSFECLLQEVNGMKNAEQAATWFFLLTTCYNGVVKFRDDGTPNLTIGTRLLNWNAELVKYRRGLLRVHDALQGMEVQCAEWLIAPNEDGAIWFLDPPWFSSEENYGVDFNHEYLAWFLKEYICCKWLLTINRCPESEALYLPVAKWSMDLSPYYGVAPTVGGRFKREELLLANFKPVMFGG